MANPPGPQARRLVLLVWVLVAFFYFYLSYDYIRVTSNDRKLEEYTQYIVQLTVDEHRPPKEARTLIQIKAEELKLPIKPDQIVISGGGQTLRVLMNYVVDIEIPIFDKGIYRKEFQHEIGYQQRR